MLEANIDDSSPQVLGYAMERLLEAGALDVTLSPVLMKKSRPGTLLRVIARPEDREALARMIFARRPRWACAFIRPSGASRRGASMEVETPHGNGAESRSPKMARSRPNMKIAGGWPMSPACRCEQIMAEANLAYLKNSR